MAPAFLSTRLKFQLVLWSADLLGKWRLEKKIPHLHTLMKGSQQHKLFCFATVLVIQTIIADMNVLGNAWCFIRSVAAAKYDTWNSLAYLAEICWKKHELLFLPLN